MAIDTKRTTTAPVVARGRVEQFRADLGLPSLVELEEPTAAAREQVPTRQGRPNCGGCRRVASSPAIRVGRFPAHADGLAEASKTPASPNPKQKVASYVPGQNGQYHNCA